MAMGTTVLDRPLAAPHFLATEATISDRLGETVEHPVRLFDLDALGVSFEALRARVAPSFSQLPWDEYDTRRERVEFLKTRFPDLEALLDDFLPGYFAGGRELDQVRPLIDALDDLDRAGFDRIKPYRRRAIATYAVRKSNRDSSGWETERLPDSPFAQSPDHERDFRALERRFAPSPPEVTESEEYQAVIKRLAALTAVVCDGTVTSMRIVCHQMGLQVRPSRAVTNAPEGIHQDGSDYIVSALVIERSNVEGGESIVYGPDKRTEYLRHTLLEGQGIFQADAGSDLWHWATPARRTDSDMPQDAVRNILGYDVHLD